MKKKNNIFVIFSLGLCLLVISSISSIPYTNAIQENFISPTTINISNRPNWFLTPTEIISTESGSNSDYADIVVDQYSNIHVTWHDETNYLACGADHDIFYKKWVASTETWTTTEVISTESISPSRYPSIVVDDSDNIHIIWYDISDYGGSEADPDIFYKRWNASISSWGTTEIVSTESIGDADKQEMAIDSSGQIHIIWQDNTDIDFSGTDYDIHHKILDKNNFTLSPVEIISTESSGDSINPTMACDIQGNIHLAWEDETLRPERDIYYKYWDKNTSSWTLPEVISMEKVSTITHYPNLAVDVFGNVHLVWTFDPGSANEILYTKRIAETSVWSPIEFVSSELSGNNLFPQVQVDLIGNVHVSWYSTAYYTGEGTDQDIFYRFRSVYSASWSESFVVSTESLYTSSRVDLSVDSLGHISFAYTDYTDILGSGGDWDIHYKKYVGPPEIPKLAPILPAVSESDSVYLNWDYSYGATIYYIYRSLQPIWSIESLTPIISTSNANYIDTLSTEALYFYALVAGNFAGNSTVSNFAFVEYELPHLREFTTTTSILVSLTIISIVFFRFRRKKNMP